MSNPVWPTTLPQNPYQNGPQIAPDKNLIRSPVDAGPAKQRRRFTAVTSPVTFTLILSEAEIAILETFVVTTLQDALPFDWIDFKTTSTVATYRFTQRPQYTWHAADLWQVAITLEKLP